MKYVIRGIVALTIFLIVFFTTILITSSLYYQEEPHTSVSESDKTIHKAVNDAKENVSVQTVIVDNDYFTMTYEGISHYEDLNVWYLDTLIENKTDYEITVYPEDSSVDDMTILMGSGIPATMQGGKKFKQSWILWDNEPKEKIESVFYVVDENFNELYRTENIVIDVK